MKQKKAKTKYTHDRCFAFLFIANKLDPSEKPFYKLGLRVSSGFPNTPIHQGFQTLQYNKSTRPLPRSLISFLVFRNPVETVAFVYEA